MSGRGLHDNQNNLMDEATLVRNVSTAVFYVGRLSRARTKYFVSEPLAVASVCLGIQSTIRKLFPWVYLSVERVQTL